MVNTFFSNSLWQLVRQSDFMSKMVLLVLLGMSILCWTLFFYKLVLLRLKRRHLEVVNKLIRQAKSLEEVTAITAQYSGTLPGYFLGQNLFFVKELLERQQKIDLERIKEHIQYHMEELLHKQESYLPLFSTIASVSPLLGLFGTVWGLIQAFIGISEQQAADIATVAPGIAEALITTLGGLMVAIPALIMFNYLLTQTSRLEAQLLQLADNYSYLVERFLMDRSFTHATQEVSLNTSP